MNTYPDRKKLRKLAEIEGYGTVTEMIERTIHDSVSPAICVNDDCTYTTPMEPDQDRGWCEDCGTNTVKSTLILEGLI